MTTYTQLSLWEQPKEIDNANYRECSIREGCSMCQHKGLKGVYYDEKGNKVKNGLDTKDWCKLLDKEIKIGHTCDYREEFRR
jgi:hypothetical protein